MDTGLGEGFAGICRRETELVERNRLVLHDESPVTTETRFMGLTPKGPRPLPSPFPLIPGAPTPRHGSAPPRFLRACAILLWAIVWLGALNRSKRSDATAQMSSCDPSCVGIGAPWKAEFWGA